MEQSGRMQGISQNTCLHPYHITYVRQNTRHHPDKQYKVLLPHSQKQDLCRIDWNHAVKAAICTNWPTNT